MLNRRFTFTDGGGRGRFAGFVCVYAATFALNIGVNALALHVLPPWPLRTSLAWVIAQGTATALNFVMLRTVTPGGALVVIPGIPVERLGFALVQRMYLSAVSGRSRMRIPVAW
jgi:hypothetical protein